MRDTHIVRYSRRREQALAAARGGSRHRSYDKLRGSAHEDDSVLFSLLKSTQARRCVCVSASASREGQKDRARETDRGSNREKECVCEREREREEC